MVNTELEVKNLWHTFNANKDNIWVLKNINLTLNEGELVGLLGPSGCGKTTLLRLIAGFDRPKLGSIKKNGNTISDNCNLLPPERRRIGMVFQDYALFPHLNIWDNVCFGINKKKNAIERAKWLLKLLDIYELKSRYPHELSGGQRQRVALARALAPGTSLVLLDEPFCSLDVEVRSRLRSELSSVLKSCSASALLVTHDPFEALAICDRIAVMKEGEIQQYSSPSKIVSNPSNAFVGQFVLQKNILPIEHVNQTYLTAIGELTISSGVSLSENSICMFDKKSFLVEPDINGAFEVKAKEYRIDNYIIVVVIGTLKICLESDLLLNLEIGDRCNIKPIPGKKLLVLPENINSNFK